MTRAVALALLLLAQPAVAQPIAQPAACHPYEAIVRTLLEHYQESPFGMGIQAWGGVLRIFVSPQRTFTVVLIGAHGNACVVSAGFGWQVSLPTLAGEPS
jgi:hypothetical protein